MALDVVGGRAREAGEGAGAVEHRAPALALEAGGLLREAVRAAVQSTGTAVSAAWVGVEQATAATSSSSVRSV